MSGATASGRRKRGRPRAQRDVQIITVRWDEPNLRRLARAVLGAIDREAGNTEDTREAELNGDGENGNDQRSTK